MDYAELSNWEHFEIQQNIFDFSKLRLAFAWLMVTLRPTASQVGGY